MDIYSLSNKEIRKCMREFNKTVYGKTIFVISYSTFLISLIVLIVFAIASSCSYNHYLLIILQFPYLMVGMFLTLISFVIGSAYYYHELKEYIKTKKPLKKSA